MNYFIDFEATQYTNEIISIGCVDGTGREFYTLVKPRVFRTVTERITEITGLTAESLSSAPDADEAFIMLYDFINKDETAAFYCYGNCDRLFLKSTMTHLSDFRAQCAAALAFSTMVDFSPVIARHFKVRQTIALIKVVNYYRGQELTQRHNALEDALFLKEIFERSANEVITETPFPEYIIVNRPPSDDYLVEKVQNPKVKAIKGDKVFAFKTYGKAGDWIMENLYPKNKPHDLKLKNLLCNRIKSAADHKKKYFGFTWEH